MLPRPIRPVYRHPLAHPIKRTRLSICGQRSVLHIDRRGMDLGGLLRLLDVHNSSYMVDSYYFTELLISEIHALARPHLALLRVERVDVRWHVSSSVDSLHKPPPCQA